MSKTHNQIKAIIFDMDGVIVDSEPLFDNFLKKYCKKLGVHLTQAHLESYRGKTSRGQWTEIINEFSLTRPVDDLTIDARQNYLQHIKTVPIKPIHGVSTLIKKLSKKFILVLASSASPHRIRVFLKKTKLEKFFEVVISADDVVNGKPAPDIFLLAAKKAGIQFHQCVVIEDATNGIKAAKNAGMKVIAFSGLPHNKQDLSKADTIVKKFNEITIDFIENF